MSDPIEITVRQDFSVAPSRVHAAWLDAATLGAWMFQATMQDEVLHVQIDPRVGGRFSFLVRRGGQEIEHVGEYLELRAPERLAFTWGVAGMGAPARVAIGITPDGTGSTATLTTELPAEWADYAERTKAGWRRILAAQAAALS